MEVGDLVIACEVFNFYSGVGIITDIDTRWSNKFYKVYWVEEDRHVWEQIHHLEVYCESR